MINTKLARRKKLKLQIFEKDINSIIKKEKELHESIYELIEEDKINDKKVSSLINEFFQFENDKLDLRRKHLRIFAMY